MTEITPDQANRIIMDMHDIQIHDPAIQYMGSNLTGTTIALGRAYLEQCRVNDELLRKLINETANHGVLMQKCRKITDALQFYAEKENYNWNGKSVSESYWSDELDQSNGARGGFQGILGGTPIHNDGGQKAREALEAGKV